MRAPFAPHDILRPVIHLLRGAELDARRYIAEHPEALEPHDGTDGEGLLQAIFSREYREDDLAGKLTDPRLKKRHQDTQRRMIIDQYFRQALEDQGRFSQADIDDLVRDSDLLDMAVEFSEVEQQTVFFVAPALALPFAHVELSRLPTSLVLSRNESVVRVIPPPDTIAYSSGYLHEVAVHVQEGFRVMMLVTVMHPRDGLYSSHREFHIRGDDSLEQAYLKDWLETDEPYRILVNTLAYYTSTDADVLRQINPAFDSLRRRYSKAPDGSTKRRKIRDQMKEERELEHFVMGLRLETIQRRAEPLDGDVSLTESSPERDVPTSETASPKIRHWVREHWRWQACGQRLAERKLTLVRGHERGSSDLMIAYRLVP